MRLKSTHDDALQINAKAALERHCHLQFATGFGPSSYPRATISIPREMLSKGLVTQYSDGHLTVTHQPSAQLTEKRFQRRMPHRWIEFKGSN